MKVNKRSKQEELQLILEEVSEHLVVVRELLTDAIELLEPKKKAIEVEVKIKNPYDNKEITEEDLEQLEKDLEEIFSDFARE